MAFLLVSRLASTVGTVCLVSPLVTHDKHTWWRQATSFLFFFFVSFRFVGGTVAVIVVFLYL